MFKLPPKTIFIMIVIIVVIGFIIFIYFIGKKAGKPTTITPVPLPSDQPGGTVLTANDNAQIVTIANSLHEDMSGLNINIFSRNLTPYNNLLQASDTIFVAVYNEFNALYGAEDSGTLADWIRAERSLDSQWLNTAKSILDRMSRLNLR